MLTRYNNFIEMGIFDDWDAMSLNYNETEQLKDALDFLKECNVASLQTQKASL